MAGASVPSDSGGVAAGWWIQMRVFCSSVAGGADPGRSVERFSERFFSRFEFAGFESGCSHPPTGTSAFPGGFTSILRPYLPRASRSFGLACPAPSAPLTDGVGSVLDREVYFPLAGYAGPGFHTWPPSHIPQDTAPNPLLRIRSPCQKDVRKGVRRGDRGQRPTASANANT